MELAQIRMFKTVSDTGSIARAAEVLHCVPSNITARIKSLEAELGVALFYRYGRGLRISPAGEVFLTYAAKILALTDEAKRAVDPSAEPSGPLRIGAIESSATGRLPRLLAKFHARFPSVSLELSTGTWSQLLDDTLSHKLDGVIVAVDVERPLLKRTFMYREDLVLIASPSLDPCVMRWICRARQSSCGRRDVPIERLWNSGCCVRGKRCQSSASPATGLSPAASVQALASLWFPEEFLSNTGGALAGPAMNLRSSRLSITCSIGTSIPGTTRHAMLLLRCCKLSLNWKATGYR